MIIFQHTIAPMICQWLTVHDILALAGTGHPIRTLMAPLMAREYVTTHEYIEGRQIKCDKIIWPRLARTAREYITIGLNCSRDTTTVRPNSFARDYTGKLCVFAQYSSAYVWVHAGMAHYRIILARGLKERIYTERLDPPMDVIDYLRTTWVMLSRVRYTRKHLKALIGDDDIYNTILLAYWDWIPININMRDYARASFSIFTEGSAFERTLREL